MKNPWRVGKTYESPASGEAGQQKEKMGNLKSFSNLMRSRRINFKN